MSSTALSLRLLDLPIIICRFGANELTPDWAMQSPWFSLTRTHEELSIACPIKYVPDALREQAPIWYPLQVAGPLDFSLVGILSALASPLADAGVSIFAISTFDTDYVLVRDTQRQIAIDTLTRSGHQVQASAVSRM